MLARYTVTLRADRTRFPLLLANGNEAARGELDDGRHFARFVDPHPKPSYLFALVAGRLERIEDTFVTAEGRRVQLAIHAETDLVTRCGWAMQCLKMAMRWDEERFGRCYDLDVFNVVAAQDFTMGAMENKGLNIFNAKYLVADPEHATDDDYRHVLAVVGHEYFHNWSGNRVTCRDWFQLSLKEGLTVYREQEFESDLASRTLRRIEDVRTLWRAQFSEDAGPLAHPVRPAQYSEINNFYTATVYEKGSELVRMLAVLLGTDGFRRGLDLYYTRHDGEAVAVEDFLAALGAANGRDLSAWLGWYNQAGTPLLSVRGRYDAPARRYEIALAQRTTPTPDQPRKHALPLPVAVQLFGADGRALRVRLDGEDTATNAERVLPLNGDEATFRFIDVNEPPVVSMLRGYSAPVRLDQNADDATLAQLTRHDTDGFNRWFAADTLARRLFARTLAAAEPDPALLDLWSTSVGRVLGDDAIDPALVAEILTLADATSLTAGLTDIDPEAVHRARTQIECGIARALAGALRTRYASLGDGGADVALEAQARRRLRNVCLAALCRADPKHLELARAVCRRAQSHRSAGRARRAGQRRRAGRAGRARRFRSSLCRRLDGFRQMVLGAGDACRAGHARARRGADAASGVPLAYAELGVCIAGGVRAPQSACVPPCGRRRLPVRRRRDRPARCDQPAGRRAAGHRVRAMAQLRARAARADAPRARAPRRAKAESSPDLADLVGRALAG